MTEPNPSVVVLIDDDEEHLARLGESMREAVSADEAVIETWFPIETDNFYERLEEFKAAGAKLVISDLDLTRRGLTGSSGAAVSSWFQSELIPVGVFSVKHATMLPSVPELFELRVPTEVDKASSFAVATLRGFRQLRELLDSRRDEVSSMRSPAQVLANLLGRGHLEGQFALYMARLGASGSTVTDRLRGTAVSGEDAAPDRNAMLAYVLGHVLWNLILRFPGPILSARALCAYLATARKESDALAGLFVDAEYLGPFCDGGPFYWREDIDSRLYAAFDGEGGIEFETLGLFNRAAAERLLGRELARHECTRCDGKNGGFLCPVTDRPVCELAECSVSASSWIPAGAEVCRIERNFYEEWAPLLGL